MESLKEAKLHIKPIQNRAGFKILKMHGKAGAVLRKHKTDRPAVLIITSGSLVYRESDRVVELSGGDAHDIPPIVFHELEFTADTEVLLVMASESKIEFKK